MGMGAMAAEACVVVVETMVNTCLRRLGNLHIARFVWKRVMPIFPTL